MPTDERLLGAVAVRRSIASCTRCPLRAEATAPVPWSGPLGAQIGVLGEAPGRTEDREGKPFVGPAGNLLRGILSRNGLVPDDCAWLNSACCYPSASRTPDPSHLESCRTHLVGQLAAIQPEYLLVVGVTALSAVVGSYVEMKQVHGRPLWLQGLAPWPDFAKPVVCWPIYHPAAALRGGRYRLLIEEDVQRFSSWVSNQEAFPGTCVRCGDEVERWDEYGLAWCGRHAGKQLRLL